MIVSQRKSGERGCPCDVVRKGSRFECSIRQLTVAVGAPTGTSALIVNRTCEVGATSYTLSDEYGPIRVVSAGVGLETYATTA